MDCSAHLATSIARGSILSRKALLLTNVYHHATTRESHRQSTRRGKR